MPQATPLSPAREVARTILLPLCEALAAAPGALYPVVYVGPLARGDVLSEVVREAAETAGCDVADWPDASRRVLAPAIVVSALDEAASALPSCAAAPGVQLLLWGEATADQLPPGLLGPDDLLVDLRAQALRPSAAAWAASAVDGVLADPTGAANPLVVLASGDDIRERADQMAMHMEAAGVLPLEIDLGTGDFPAAPLPRPAVVTLRAPAGAVHAAALADACRRSGTPLVLVVQDRAWESVGRHPAWSAGAVLAAGHGPPGISGLPWPRPSAMWAGAPWLAPLAARDALLLPPETTLVEALSHVEVRGRPARLVAWSLNRFAVVEVDQRPGGAVVVGVRTMGAAAPAEREGVLADLVSLRSSAGLTMAIVEADPVPIGGISESVQRIGFHFSRLDDEGAAPAPPGGAGGAGQVARALVSAGLAPAAQSLLGRAAREAGLSADEEILLAFLLADALPDEAVAWLRSAAQRLAEDEGSEDIHADAVLNGLLLMVRSEAIGAPEAWASVDAWLPPGTPPSCRTPRHAAVLFELATRAGQFRPARSFAATFLRLAPAGDSLRAELAPVIASVEARW